MGHRGFTIVEILITLVVVSVLTMLALPRFSLVRLRTEGAEAGPILKQICALAESEQLESSRWPTELTAAAVHGWEQPLETRFTYFVSGGGASPSIASAVPDEAGASGGLQTQTMNCATKLPA